MVFVGDQEKPDFFSFTEIDAMQTLRSETYFYFAVCITEEQSPGKFCVSGLNALSLIDMYGCGRIPFLRPAAFGQRRPMEMEFCCLHPVLISVTCA
jgi:hypothetical protein